MDRSQDMGVSPQAGPGHSAKPEPISVVSAAMAASVPNAVLIFLDLIERNTSTLDHALIEANALAERRGWDRYVVEPWMPFLLALRQRMLHERLVEPEESDNQKRLFSEKQPKSVVELLGVVGRMRADLAMYDYLLPGDYVPDPPTVKRWFRWRPAFEVTQDMIVWAGAIARARSLMDLKAVEDAIAGEAQRAETTGSAGTASTRAEGIAQPNSEDNS